MFNSDFVLSKKGPLARIWLAAHWDKKLTKAQIFETNIESSIERILRPKVKLALRTSGHLMLGVVRIYSRKTKYLLADCNEAFVKIKMAFRPGMVDLPEDHREAAVNAVTLPEVFHDFDSVMPDLNNMDIEVQLTLNQSRVDEITMREDYGNVLPLHTEDGFDLGFDATSSDILRHSVGFDQSLQQANLLFGESIDSIEKNRDKPSTSDISAALGHVSMDVDMPKDDGFGPLSGGGLFEGGLFEDTPMTEITGTGSSERVGDSMEIDPSMPSTSKQSMNEQPFNDDDDIDNFVPPSPPGGSSDDSRPSSPTPAQSKSEFSGYDLESQPGPSNAKPAGQSETDVFQSSESGDVDVDPSKPSLQNEEESFALAPVNATTLTGQAKSKRKRKLIVDEVKNISGEEMKAQLCDTSDIVTTLDLAPPTKRLMRWKESGGVEKLFSLPAKPIPAGVLYKNYQRHLITPASTDEGQEDIGHDGTFAVPAPPVPGKRGRKRKKPLNEEQFQEFEPQLKSPNVDHFALDNNQLGQVPNMNLGNSEVPWPNAEEVKSMNMQQPSGTSPFDNLSAPFIPNNTSVQQGAAQWDQNAEFSNSSFVNPMSDQFSNPMGGVTPVHQLDADKAAASAWDAIQSSALPRPNETPLHSCDDASIYNANLGSETPWHDTDYDNPPSVRMDKSPSDAHFDNVPNTDNTSTSWYNSNVENTAPVTETAEEQGVDETLEQFEERVLNKRANHLYGSVKIRISTGIITTFDDVVVNNPRKQIAQKFYSLLVLKKHRVLELTQEMPYDSILLTKGPNFDDPKL